MSVLIRGMEMPTKCADCLFIDYFKGQWYCHSINDILETGSSKRDERCNLVPVPPHGRLIEKGKTLDACYTHFEDYMNGKIDGKTALLNIEKEIKAAPTIIPASEEGE